MKFLLKSVDTYRVANEAEAKALIEEAKNDRNFILTKYTSEQKEKKVKGEVEDSWIRVTLTKSFTDEKEPERTVSISYDSYAGAFPDPVEKDEDDDEEDYDDEDGGLNF